MAVNYFRAVIHAFRSRWLLRSQTLLPRSVHGTYHSRYNMLIIGPDVDTPGHLWYKNP